MTTYPLDLEGYKQPGQILLRRWWKAVHVVARGIRTAPSASDRWLDPLLRYIRFLHGFTSCRPKQTEEAKAIERAHGIYQAADAQRWELEARLLTDEPIEEIARKADLKLETVQAFNAVFFEIRDDQDNRLNSAFFFLAFRPLWEEKDPPAWAIWRYAGLYCGSGTVDALATEQRGETIHSEANGETAWERVRMATKEAFQPSVRPRSTSSMLATPDSAAEIFSRAIGAAKS
jgi:hypothetical protein